LMKKLKERALWLKNQIRWVVRIVFNHHYQSKRILTIQPNCFF
jgi:hypothetical protein